MSRERKFHEFIEQQNREEKEAVWAKLQQEDAEKQEKSAPALPKARSFFGRKWVTIAASSLAVVVIGAFSAWGFLSLKDGNNDNNGRYFTSQSYETVNTQRTLKDYAQEIGENLLYFDWYAETDYLKNQAWQLKDTQEIICFQEEIIDINTGSKVKLLVMPVDTIIEDFFGDEETDQKSEMDGVQIDWKYSKYNSNANFVYEGYKYYLRVDEPIDENHILDLVEELLP